MVEGVVYFLHAPEVRRVKIGRSIDLGARIKAIELMSPVHVELIGTVPGNHEAETAYHRKWAALRVRGEWFDATDELIAELQQDALMAAWSRAGSEARSRFIDSIDGAL